MKQSAAIRAQFSTCSSVCTQPFVVQPPHCGSWTAKHEMHHQETTFIMCRENAFICKIRIGKLHTIQQTWGHPHLRPFLFLCIQSYREAMVIPPTKSFPVHWPLQNRNPASLSIVGSPIMPCGSDTGKGMSRINTGPPGHPAVHMNWPLAPQSYSMSQHPAKCLLQRDCYHLHHKEDTGAEMVTIFESAQYTAGTNLSSKQHPKFSL